VPFDRAPLRTPSAADKRMAPALARVTPAPATPVSAPRVSGGRGGAGMGVIQRFANVSSPSDRAEVEAVHTARTVMRMSTPTPASVGMRAPGTVHRALAGNAPALHPKPAAAQVPGAGAGGGNLPAGVRKFMEPRFGADFSGVRVHTGDAAAKQSQQIDAAAFTSGRDIHFGKNRFQPDSASGKELIAHELTHTIQQGAVKQSPAAASAVRERPAKGVHRGGGILDWFADKANYIPGFRMFTIVLGMNPVNMAAVDRSPANVLRAVIEFIPGGKAIGDALESHGIFDRIGAWVNQKLTALAMVGGSFKSAIDKYIDGIDATDILWVPGWGKLWENAKRIFTEPIDRLKNFVAGLATEIIQFIREAILLPLAALAEGTKGYPLLKAVLGEDPVTGEKVPRNADTLMGGFMLLIGEEEIWLNIKKANAIPRCWAWFQTAMSELVAMVSGLPGRFVAAFKALEVADMILVPRAFVKIATVFAGFVVDFVSWGGKTAWKLLEIIFEVVAPAAIPYLKKVGDSFKQILKNPIAFVGNLVKAGKLGFEKFADNIGAHLKKSILEWLTGSLPGVYIPAKLDLKEILKFALSVLGLTWANIRVKLVKAIGETAVTVLEKGFDIVVALVTEGPAAAWDKIKEQLAELKNMVIGAITNFVVETIVKKAVMKVVSLLIPGGAFIQAIISIYDTIMVFIDKLSKIIQVAKAFLDSMMDIVAGKLDGAAKKVESVLAGLLTLAISFLAGFLGLGKIADKVMEIIKKIRAPIDKAMDFLINWIVNAGKKLFNKAKNAVKDWWKDKKPFTAADGEGHEITFQGDEKNAEAFVASGQKTSVKAKLTQFETLMNGPDATDDQKKAGPRINAARKTLQKDPNDPKLVDDMKSLFDTFELKVKDKKMEVKYTAGNIGGSPVGVGMTIDWLSPKHVGHPDGSSPKDSALSVVMDKLVTDPGKPSDRKFVKGHLLNDRIGGPGEGKNLFPITAHANSLHRSAVERVVIVDWLKKANTNKRWVFYRVNVGGISSKFNGSTIGQNYVQCTYSCQAILKDAAGKPENTFSTDIVSNFKADAEVLEVVKKK
jgi:hypothetical protein